jgi:exosortase
MQDITAKGSWVFLNLIGVDTDRTGNILTVWDNGVSRPLNIAEACSGMRMLMAFLALGVAMAYTCLRQTWQQVVFVLLGIPTAIFVNILRVATLAVLSLFDTNFAAGDFHTFIGLLWLVPAFLMYLGLLWILRHLVVEEPVSPAGEAS